MESTKYDTATKKPIGSSNGQSYSDKKEMTVLGEIKRLAQKHNDFLTISFRKTNIDLLDKAVEMLQVCVCPFLSYLSALESNVPSHDMANSGFQKLFTTAYMALSVFGILYKQLKESKRNATEGTWLDDGLLNFATLHLDLKDLLQRGFKNEQKQITSSKKWKVPAKLFSLAADVTEGVIKRSVVEFFKPCDYDAKTNLMVCNIQKCMRSMNSLEKIAVARTEIVPWEAIQNDDAFMVKNPLDPDWKEQNTKCGIAREFAAYKKSDEKKKNENKNEKENKTSEKDGDRSPYHELFAALEARFVDIFAPINKQTKSYGSRSCSKKVVISLDF